jgi:hypothetical protein
MLQRAAPQCGQNGSKLQVCYQETSALSPVAVRSADKGGPINRSNSPAGAIGSLGRWACLLWRGLAPGVVHQMHAPIPHRNRVLSANNYAASLSAPQIPPPRWTEFQRGCNGGVTGGLAVRRRAGVDRRRRIGVVGHPGRRGAAPARPWCRARTRRRRSGTPTHLALLFSAARICSDFAETGRTLGRTTRPRGSNEAEPTRPL